jgi:hypothetical protein
MTVQADRREAGWSNEGSEFKRKAERQSDARGQIGLPFPIVPEITEMVRRPARRPTIEMRIRFGRKDHP